MRKAAGGGTKAFLHHPTDLGSRYSVGSNASTFVLDALARLPRQAWRAALEADGQPRDGAQVAELTRWLPDMTGHGWPVGMRVVASRERPHPGAQLPITDPDGWPITVLATNTADARLADLEVGHRLRARAEDRIRGLKDTGLPNLPLHRFAKNEIWLELVRLAADPLTWTQPLALTGTPARVWEPERLRLPRSWPWNDPIIVGHQRLHALT